MSDDPTRDAIAALLARERELELEAVTIAARIEEVRDMLNRLERPTRKRPGPKVGPRVVRLEEPPAANTEPTDAA